MFNAESQTTIGADWNNRYVNLMIDTLTKKASSSVYIAKDQSRQVAMKSLIGLLSGNFRQGDEVKITVIGENEDNARRDLKLAEELLKGEYHF
ncbi:MAG: HPr family phosphocarrier protein [Oscillospiraceae bacterium]|jgi:phosphotransferase system HPr-like phosphotransfer protein|nr:HPr family phosphocarrier protein [Oscillospiraceae bacterium]